MYARTDAEMVDDRMSNASAIDMKEMSAYPT